MLTTPAQKYKYMSKASGNTRKVLPSKSINNFIEEAFNHNKEIYLNKYQYKQGIMDDVKKGLNEEQLREKWLYDEKTSPTTSNGSHVFITKNGTFEVLIYQDKARSGRLKGTTVTNKVKTFLINKNGKEIYSGSSEVDKNTGRVTTPKSYKEAFKKMWE